MTTGTLKWFSTEKGYGFIARDDGSPDVFVHISALQRAGLYRPRERQPLQFEIQAGKNGRSQAVNIRTIT